MGVVFIGDAVVGGDRESPCRIAQVGHLPEGHPPPPFMFAAPAGHGQPGVGGVTHRHRAPRAVSEVAVQVEVNQIVDRVHPGLQGRFQLVRVLGEDHLPHGVQCAVGRLQGGIAEGQGCGICAVSRDGGRISSGVFCTGAGISGAVFRSGGGATGDDRSVAGGPGVDGDGAFAPHGHRLAGVFRGQPLALKPVAGRLPGRGRPLKALDEQILVVRVAMGDAPGHPGVVGEVGESRHAGKGKADHVELAAGHVVLVVHVGNVQGAVGVPGQEGLARGGVRAAHHPVVAAVFGAVFEERQVAQALGEGLGRVEQGPAVAPSGWRHHYLAGFVPRIKSRRPLRPQGLRQPHAPDLGLPHAHQDMAHAEHGQGVLRAPGFGFDPGQAELDPQRPPALLTVLDESVDPGGIGLQHGPGGWGQTGQHRRHVPRNPEAAHLQIPLQRLAAHHLRPAAGGAAPVIFHLPQPILGRDESLAEPGIVLRGRPEMGDAMGVPVNGEGGLQPRAKALPRNGRHGGAQVFRGKGMGIGWRRHRLRN